VIGFPPRRVCVLVLCMAVAGCSGYARYNRMGPVHEMLPPQPDYCGALALHGLIGQPFTTLADQQLIGPLRILWPGQEIGSDIDPIRLDAEVADDQRILALFCG